MLLKFTDWEVEKEFIEEFWGYEFRYELELILSQNEQKHKAVNMVYSNNLGAIVKTIGNIVIHDNNIQIEFVENSSLKSLKRGNRQCTIC